MFELLTLKGEADRSEWWVVNIFAGVVAEVCFLFGLILMSEGDRLLGGGCLVVVIVAVWAGIAVTARRFLSRGESAWMTLLLLVPLLGVVWVVVACGVLPDPNEVRRTVITQRISR